MCDRDGVLEFFAPRKDAIISVDGWLLSLTEARIYVLATLSLRTPPTITESKVVRRTGLGLREFRCAANRPRSRP